MESKNNQQMKILHTFADIGVESEVLREYGEVVRLGIDPRNEKHEIVVQGDGTNMPFSDNEFDLTVGHPPCTPYTNLAQLNASRYDDYEVPDTIVPEAKEEIRRVSKDYIIENKTEAPIRKDVILEGSMFGVPYKKERAFEVSFDIGEPPERDEGVNFRSEWQDDKGIVLRSKGYTDKRIGKGAKKASIPRPYIEWLLGQYLSA